MTISVGDRLPEATFMTMTDEGPQKVTTSDVFAGQKVVLFAVPGAFTPTCHAKHLPGFIQLADAIRARGVDRIACVAVNDVFVLGAWARQLGADNIQFLADGRGIFTRAIGMETDPPERAYGPRSERYAMIVDDGVVTALFVEPKPGQAIESSAENVLAAL
ncbi:MAG: peroxiredoxin [Hyphomicrobiales bacterium]